MFEITNIEKHSGLLDELIQTGHIFIDFFGEKKFIFVRHRSAAAKLNH